jgi:hypothetical protein
MSEQAQATPNVAVAISTERLNNFAQALRSAVATEKRAAAQRADGKEAQGTDQQRMEDVKEVHRTLVAWLTKGTLDPAKARRVRLSGPMSDLQWDGTARLNRLAEPPTADEDGEDQHDDLDCAEILPDYVHSYGFTLPELKTVDKDDEEEPYLSLVQRAQLEMLLEAYFAAMIGMSLSSSLPLGDPLQNALTIE